MKVLFLSNQLPGNRSAYDTRLDGLRMGLESLGVTTGWHSVRQMRFARPNLLFPLNAPQIARLARGYDVVHAGGTGVALAASAARRWGGPMVVYDVHGDEVQEARLTWRMERSPHAAYVMLQARLIGAPARRGADHLLMVSETFYNRYRDEKNVNPERMSLVLNGADTRTFAPADDYAPMQASLTHVCYAGSYQSWQATDQLIAAFEQVKHPNVHFHLLGFNPNNPGDRTLKSDVTTSLGDRVTCVDWMSKPDLIRALQYMDVLIIPRTRDTAMRGGLPSKFAEYLALGKPLVVTDVDDTARYVREHDCGLICKPDANSMADALRRVLLMSPDTRIRMAANARHLAETVFDWRVIAADYLQTLHTLVDQTQEVQA